MSMTGPPLTTTSTAAKTTHVVTFRGQQVTLELDLEVGLPVCDVDKHDIVVMHHTDESGLHYCPTGFVYCYNCMAIGTEPEPYECTKWETA